MVVSGKGTELPQKGSVLQIKQDDKFFCRLLSKETSMSHPSFRVAAVAVPFVWESQPGTPKYTIFSEDTLPPLTPPPSYFTSKTNKSKPGNKKLGSRSSNNLLLTLFLKLGLKKSNNVLSGHNTNSSSSSSSSPSPAPSSFSFNCSSSWSSSNSSSKAVVPPIGKVERRRFLSIGSSFDFRADEEELGGVTSSPTSTLCFGIHRSASSKANYGGSCRR